jgi:hypothetical protein
MNIFRVLASGRQPMREEYISALLAYLLAPRMDHGLGTMLLATLLRAIGQHTNASEFTTLATKLDPRLRDNLFEGPGTEISVELELIYPVGTSYGAIDVVVRCDEWFIVIENKILGTSISKGQVAAQYQGLRQVLATQQLAERKVLMIYLVPALRNETGWSLAQAAVDELNFALNPGDRAALVTWQPTSEHPLAFVELLRTILKREGRGEIAPLSSEIRHTLLALIDFALGEFRGYPYQSTGPDKPALPQRRVQELLQANANEALFVGVQYGMAGVLRRAWRKPNFASEALAVSPSPNGWQYLPLREFQALARWAMNPEGVPLHGIAWSGKPFWTAQLYLVAKAAGDTIWIGMRGGLAALHAMSAEEIRERQIWEISDQQRSSQWFPGSVFCAVLEGKGVAFSSPW